MANKVNRLVNLTLRQAQVTNLNFQPERNGEELVERMDVSLTFLLERDDADEIINAGSQPLKVLWDKTGRPMLRDVPKISLDFVSRGKCSLGSNGVEALTFDPAVLKKITLHPIMKWQAEVSCQVRVDPTDHLEELAEMRIREECEFSFTGSDVTEEQRSDKDRQDQLEV